MEHYISVNESMVSIREDLSLMIGRIGPFVDPRTPVCFYLLQVMSCQRSPTSWEGGGAQKKICTSNKDQIDQA